MRGRDRAVRAGPLALHEVGMTGDLLFGIVAVVGIAATLAVIGGFLVRAGGHEADRQFATLRRPEDLAAYPSVAIVVPARNAERHIGACLESLLALDYPRLEIVVVDDHSTDHTAALVREIAGRRDPRRDVRLFLLADSPEEADVQWVWGKSRALWHGAQRAHGEWLLFVDADTRQEPDALWRALTLARRRDLEALSLTGVSVIPGLCGDLLEAVVYPAIFLAVSWRRVNDPEDPAAWMNGQFILYRRATYLAVGGHRAVAGHVGEDTALAIHSKERRVRTLFLPVTTAYESRDFADCAEAFRGWTRRLAVGGARLRLSRRSYAAEAGLLFLVGVWPALAGVAVLLGRVGTGTVLGVPVAALPLVQLGAVVLLQAVVRSAMRKPAWPAVLAPVGAALGVGVVLAAYRARFVTRAVESRGRALGVGDGGGPGV
jgi:chlorobactene glucosyltransferase